jgi:nitrogen fixation/metabolism regulation signal transduction histidine kinase
VRAARRRPLPHEKRILALAVLAAAPGALAALLLLGSGDYSPKVRWTVVVLILGAGAAFTHALRERAVRPLQTLSNLLGALREGDFSIRARGARADDALGEALVEVNALAETLREQRLGALEAGAILRTVMEEIDAAVVALDAAQRIRIANRAAARLLGRPAGRLLGRTAAEVGLAACLEGDTPRVMDAVFPGGAGRWEVRRSAFRQGGLPHQLLVLSDLSRVLREEERLAWQRLIRVLGHEMNNSLAPIKSIAGSLERLLAREPRPPDWEADARRGLSVVAGRAESLSRFMEAYARLARLPRPAPRDVDVGPLLRRVCGLETRVAVAAAEGPPTVIHADVDQIEQLLINLVRNAADAAQETGGGVRAGWTCPAGSPGTVEIWVEDDGPGLPGSANLFVPFFTTKPGGSGIGLVLSRQIAEAHGGSLVLENRADARGCRARLRLPVRYERAESTW